MTGRNLLLAMLAALVAMTAFVTLPTIAEANTGLGATGGDRSGSAPNPLDFGNNLPSGLPKQYTVYMYNDSSGLSGQSLSNTFTISGTGYRRNGGDCNGTATGTSWTTSLDVSLFGSSKSCSIILELQSGTANGLRTGTISFTSTRSIENGNSRNLTGTISDEIGNVIRTYDPSNTQITSRDFGGVAVGDMSDFTITLKNTGSTDMTSAARAISGSSAFTIQSTTCGATLAIAASCTVTVRYAPSAVGTDSGSLDFTSGSGHSKSVSLAGQGFAPVADISVTPMHFDYGGVANGYPAAKAYTVSNTGNTTLNLGFAIDGGTDPAVFYRNGGTCGATLAVGSSCTMAVEFNPDTVAAAHQTGSFTVTGSTPLVGSPATKQVTVEGTREAQRASIEIRDTAGTTELTSRDFGTVAMGSSGSYTFTIRNTGNVPVPSIAPALSGPEASNYSITSNSCGASIPRDLTCQVTIQVTPTLASQRRATLTMTPGAAAVTASPKAVTLTTSVSGIKIKNDVSDNFGSTAKRWLDSPSLGTAGLLAGDIVRTAFEVELPAGSSVAGVDIVGATTTNDTAPTSGYQNISDLSAGSVVVDRKPGSNQALIKASVPLSSTNLGTSAGNYGFSSGTDAVVSCGIFGSGEGTGETSDRRVWFRIRGSNGEISSTVGSIVRFHWQTYACPYKQGPYLSNQRILNVNGGSTLPSSTIETNASKTDPVTFQFQTRTYAAGAVYPSSAGSVDAMDWRIRNSKTGDMFIVNSTNYATASYVPCAEPCTVTSSTNRYTFPEGAEAGTKQFTIPPIPSRGRWIVEASPQGSDENDGSYFELGVVDVNDHSGNSPTISKTGTLGLRPNTNQAYTIGANVADPNDPTSTLDTQGGRGQVIEWDLDGNTTNGPRGDGFEVLAESDPGSALSSQDLTQTFDTTGKTPGPYTIRARVTDNGAFMANDSSAESKIMTYTTTINSPAEAQATTEEFESDQTQPANVPFTATDADGDNYRVDVTPNGGNTGTLGGNLHDVVGANTKPYSWPSTFTGSDTFDFVATDDHNGTGSHNTVTVRVRPNTQIDSSTISGLLHPDAGNPTTRFLGSTTSTSASFTFSSLQNPVVEMECKLTNDGNIVQDWTNCANSDSGSTSFSDLADGLYKVEVRAVNDEGDRDGTPVFRTWRVDNTPPEVEVFQGPPSNLPNQQPRFTNDSTPSYKFRATSTERSLQQYMTYECRVMWGPVAGIWYPCGSPSDSDSSALVDIINGNPDFGFSDPLVDGTYEIQVRGTDENGNLGPAMIEQFTVDTEAPDTALASGPEGLVNTRNVDFVLGSSQGQSTFRCKLEGTHTGVIFAMGACNGPAADGSKPSFTGLADDTYTLTATAVDPATNPDPTPLVVNFEVDATEPTTTLDPQVNYGDGPTTQTRTQSRKVDLTFTGYDARQMQGFQCRIDSNDDDAWQLCSSPQRFSGLADGEHTVEIRAKDQANNFDSTPAVWTWVIDHDPPVTSFTTQPDPVSNDADPTFEFTTNEAVSGSMCSLDDATPVACTSPFALSDLAPGGVADGNHQISVRSTDIAGNVEATVATASWRQDTVDPEVTFTSKPPAYMPIGDADFAWDVKDGNPLVLAPEADAQCALDPVDPDNVDSGEWAACGRELTVAEADNANGAHTLVVRAVDQAGNVSAPASWTWNVLGAKPVPPVVDDSSPVNGATTRVGTAYFAFHHELDGTGALEGLYCSLDGGTQSHCDSGNFSAEGLADGSHTFSVVAKDIAGNVSDPTTVSWDVQRGAPYTTIDFGPNGASKQATASFQFSSNKPGTFECKLDDGAWDTCTSPANLSGLSDGSHTFSVRAVSSVAPVGVKDPTPPSRTWTVDTVAPDVSIDSAPEGQVVSYTGDVTFSSTDPDAGFQCKVGSGLYDACSSPWHITGLSAGEQTVTVRAVDAAGNVSATPATATWTVLDPSCDADFDGTPPNCVAKTPVEGPNLHALSTGGSLSLASLGSVELPDNQLKLDGKLGSDGRWFVPASGVTFAPVTQTINDVLGPGTSVAVIISISATGNGWGTLTNGGGTAKFKLPVRADVQAKLGDVSLLPVGTECSLKPITFNLTGTYNEAAQTAHLEQTDVAFPKVTGCGSFKETIDSLLELPRNDIGLALDLAFTKDEETCTPPLVGTPPDCHEVETPNITIDKPVLKGTKMIKSGKKATYRVTLKNSGDTDASNVKACLSTPKKFVKGKAKRCKTVASIAAGKSVTVKFAVKAKKFKLRKARKLKLRATASYTDGAGAAKMTAAGLYTAKAGKTGKASGK
jgi:hypothetical protein